MPLWFRKHVKRCTRSRTLLLQFPVALDNEKRAGFGERGSLFASLIRGNCLAFESLNMFAVSTYSPNRLQRASCIFHIAVLRTDEAPCWVCFVYMKKKLLVLVPIELTVMIPTILYGWIICSLVS